jgi:hypothetical protein
MGRLTELCKVFPIGLVYNLFVIPHGILADRLLLARVPAPRPM